MSMTPEGRVKNNVKLWLKERGIWYFLPVSNGMGRVGIPDFICCVPVTITAAMVGQTVGLFAGIETKAPGKIDSTTVNQDRELKGIRAANGVAIVSDELGMVSHVIMGMQMGVDCAPAT